MTSQGLWQGFFGSLFSLCLVNKVAFQFSAIKNSFLFLCERESPNWSQLNLSLIMAPTLRACVCNTLSKLTLLLPALTGSREKSLKLWKKELEAGSKREWNSTGQGTKPAPGFTSFLHSLISAPQHQPRSCFKDTDSLWTQIRLLEETRSTRKTHKYLHLEPLLRSDKLPRKSHYFF